jgi:DNA-binding transcriptional regulator YdaS (Cro superfamily)
MNASPIQSAIAAAGSQSELARRCGVKQGHVWKWLKSGRVPPTRVLAVEAATGISRHELRPDIYPVEGQAA